ncbi:hypothetical protein HN51_024964 [Arachis hypogaea]
MNMTAKETGWDRCMLLVISSISLNWGTKKDEYLPFKMERVPFLEEQVRIIKEQGKLLTLDIYKLLLSKDNQFDFVNEIAAEANEYVDEYGG